MRFVHHPDATDFLKTALHWLLEREAENNLILSIALARAQGKATEDEPAWFGTLQEDDSLVGAVFRTPPHMLGMTAMPPEAIPLVVAAADAAFD